MGEIRKGNSFLLEAVSTLIMGSRFLFDGVTIPLIVLQMWGINYGYHLNP
jgi:hypothetical protein